VILVLSNANRLHDLMLWRRVNSSYTFNGNNKLKRTSRQRLSFDWNAEYRTWYKPLQLGFLTAFQCYFALPNGEHAEL
jgi:hypothetical protein